MNRARRTEIFARLKAANPEPTTELLYGSDFELLVAVILSAQATDISVNKATRGLYAVADTPSAMLGLGLDGLKKHIHSIGLYNTKAKNIIATCRILEKKYAGEVPRTRAGLESLPGVGRKTANVILNTAFGDPTIAEGGIQDDVGRSEKTYTQHRSVQHQGEKHHRHVPHTREKIRGRGPAHPGRTRKPARRRS